LRGNIPMTWNHDHKLLYAHVRFDPFPLSTFALEPISGKLRLIETVAMPAAMAYLSVMRNGRFLLGASYDSALLTVNRIEKDGRIHTPCLQILPTPPKTHCIIEAPFGGFVFATTVDGEAILVYRFIEKSGKLEAVSTATIQMRPGSGPRHLVFHPMVDKLYCVNEHDGSLTSYSVDRDSGALDELQNVSLVPPNFFGNAMAADIHFTPNGKFLYASVRKTNAIVAFSIDLLTGLMSSAGTFEVEANPRGFAIEPNGMFLLCAGQESNQLGVFAIEPKTGALTLVGRHAVGMRPSWIEIIPRPAKLTGPM
jgi:6-phosphogluconolactonase